MITIVAEFRSFAQAYDTIDDIAKYLGEAEYNYKPNEINRWSYQWRDVWNDDNYNMDIKFYSEEDALDVKMRFL